MHASSTSLKSRAARPMKKFDSPGETPQSTTAVEPRSRARASNWSGSSREKEMSAMGFPASMTERSIVEPSAPGSAPTTQSASETASETAPGRDRSVRRIVACVSRATRSSASGSASKTETCAPSSEASSRAMTRPMRPAPRIEIRMMTFRSGYPIGPTDSDDETHETPLDRLGRSRRGGGGCPDAGFGRAGGSAGSSPATQVGGISRTSGEAARRSPGPRLGCDSRDPFDEPRLCNGAFDASERAADGARSSDPRPGGPRDALFRRVERHPGRDGRRRPDVAGGPGPDRPGIEALPAQDARSRGIDRVFDGVAPRFGGLGEGRGRGFHLRCVAGGQVARGAGVHPGSRTKDGSRDRGDAWTPASGDDRDRGRGHPLCRVREPGRARRRPGPIRRFRRPPSRRSGRAPARQRRPGPHRLRLSRSGLHVRRHANRVLRTGLRRFSQGVRNREPRPDRGNRSSAGRPDRRGGRPRGPQGHRGRGIRTVLHPPARARPRYGWPFTDTIFPFFLFIVGVSMVFSFARRRAAGATRRELLLHSARRGAIIFGLGLALNLLSYFVFHRAHLRIPGVLQRIGVVFFFAAALYLALPRKGFVVASVLLLLGYWALMTL